MLATENEKDEKDEEFEGDDEDEIRDAVVAERLTDLLALLILSTNNFRGHPIVRKWGCIQQNEPRSNPIQIFCHRRLPQLAVLEHMEYIRPLKLIR